MENNLVKINYQEFINQKLEATNPIFLDLLQINNNNTALYICHPKHLFKIFKENDKTKQLEEVDWNLLNLKKLWRKKDFGYFNLDNVTEKKNQFSYITKKSVHMMETFLKYNIPEACYPFAILEEKTMGNKKLYFARGIINSYQDGFEIAYNPAYKIVKEENYQKKR